MKAKNTIVASTLNNTLSLTFSNGQDLHLDYTTLPTEIIQQAVLHGLKQKLVDAAAIGAKDGKYATVEQKYAAVKEVYDRITGANGKPAAWNKIRGDGEGPSTARDLLVRAIAEVKNKDIAVIDAWVDTLSKEQVTALRNNSAIAAKLAELKSRNASTDSEALLAELDIPELPDGDNEDVDDDDSDDVEPEVTEAKKPSRGRGRSRTAANADSE